MTDEIQNDAVEPSPAPAPEPAPELVDEQPELNPETFHRAVQAGDTPAEQPAGELPEPMLDVLELPDAAPDAHRLSDEARENLGMLASFAREEGVPVSDAQAMVSTFYSLNQMFEDQGLDPRDVDYQDRVHGALKRAWGSSYDQNLADARAAFKGLSPKTQRWLNETGGGDNPAVLSILAAMKNGMFRMTQAQAEAEMAALRKDSAALRSDSHPNHRGMKLKFRMLAELAARGEGDASERRSEREGKQTLKDLKNQPKADSPRVKAESEAKALMRSEAWGDKRNPAHKEVARRVAELFRVAYPERD